MGCGASKDTHIDPIDVPDTESGYPPPTPPREKKDKVFKEGDCADIDANAKRMTDDDKVRAELVEATESRDIEKLEKAIRAFEHAKLPDNGDLSRARRVLLSLHEQALQEAIKERDLKTLEAAIEAARKSSVAPELRKGETLREAESLRSLLRRLKLYLHKILEMKQPTVSEIHSYTRPRPLVHTVMKATYLLLGEKERQLQQWEYIQALLRRQGRDSIIRRIKEFDVVHMKVSTVNRAEAHLQKCNIETVRQTSAGAGTFYVWSRNIIREGKTTQKGTTIR